MPKYSVVVRQELRGTFEIEAANKVAAERCAEEMGLHGWEDPDDGWDLLDEQVEVVRGTIAEAQAGG